MDRQRRNKRVHLLVWGRYQAASSEASLPLAAVGLAGKPTDPRCSGHRFHVGGPEILPPV